MQKWSKQAERKQSSIDRTVPYNDGSFRVVQKSSVPSLIINIRTNPQRAICRSFAHSLIHFFIQSFIHSPIHSLISSPIHLKPVGLLLSKLHHQSWSKNVWKVIDFLRQFVPTDFVVLLCVATVTKFSIILFPIQWWSCKLNSSFLSLNVLIYRADSLIQNTYMFVRLFNNSFNSSFTHLFIHPFKLFTN